MRRASLALALSFVAAVPALADLPSPLELVRGLRQAGLIDLAVQRLEELKANPKGLAPEDVKLIPLELARIRLEEASRESDDSRRTTLIARAKASFDEFIKQNPTHPMAAQANVEIARLLALQAKGQLSKANRQENKEAKALEFSRARPDFTTAINRYKSAIVNLDTRIKKLGEDDPLAAELKKSKAQAELDAAVLQYELALTFIGDDERRQKGEAIDKAQKQFEAIAAAHAGDRVGFLAQVWAWQCAFANGDPKAVPAIEKFVTANRGNRDAAEAVRLAGFFGIEHTFEADGGAKDAPGAKFRRTELAAERWLRTYPDARNTPEGLGARYRQALMKEYQALQVPGMLRFADPPKPKTTPKDREPAKTGPRKIVGIDPRAKRLLEEANKIYRDLTETENEYSDRAHRHRLVNQLIVLEAEGRGGDPPLRAVNTLEQGYLAAQVQQARIFDLPKQTGMTPADVEKEEDRRAKLAIAYLERGLQRATPRDPARDVFDAQMLLIQFLTRNNRAVEAAVLGEGLARNNPRMSKAPLAALLGVYAYNTSIAKLKQMGGRDEDEEVDLRQLKELARFAIQTWPTDGPTDAVRHVLGFYQSNKDKDYEAAWNTYAAIGSGYSDVYQARREQAGAMFYLIRPDQRDPQKYREALQQNITNRAQQFQATLGALAALPDPPPSAPARQVEAWAGAKTMQAQLYYMASDYDKVDATVKHVADVLAKLPGQDPQHPDALDGKKKADLAHTIRALRFNALQGRAADFIRAKEFAKVGEVLGPEIEALKKELTGKPPEDTPGLTRLRRAQQDFLIAAMSAYVQNKQADEASQLLDALQGAGGSVEQSVAILRQLVTSIRAEIESLTRAGKKAEADELARGFGDFLDKIKGDDTSKLPNTVIVFLGEGYGAVNQHDKAAALFGEVLARPFAPDAKLDPAQRADAEAKHAVFLRQVEFLLARAHRQAGKFAEATALMQKIVGDPVTKGAARGWGYRNIGIRKEYCLLLEDQNFFGPAMKNWSQMVAEFTGSRSAPPAPVSFLGARPTFLNFGRAVDAGLAAHFGMPTGVAPFLDAGFKGAYPSVAETRNRLRLIYFDLFVETIRCSARAYSTPAIVAKLRGGKEVADQKLADLGQKLFDLLTKNDDVQPEVKEAIQDLLNQHPAMKKKFEELAAAPAPKS